MHPADCADSPSSCTTQHVSFWLCFTPFILRHTTCTLPPALHNMHLASCAVHSCILHQIKCTLLAVLYTLHPAPHSMHPAGCAVHPASCTTQHAPCWRCLTPCILYHTACTLLTAVHPHPVPNSMHFDGCDVHPASYTTQHAPCCLCSTPCILRHTTCTCTLLALLYTLHQAPTNRYTSGCAVHPASCYTQHAQHPAGWAVNATSSTRQQPPCWLCCKCYIQHKTTTTLLAVL
jgi:hypothetical protein